MYVGEFTDPALLGELARRCRVLSFDWENIPVDALRAATRGPVQRIAPPLRALAAAQDRLAEKRLFERLGIPTTRYAAVETRAMLARAVARVGLPRARGRRGAWATEGQAVLRAPADIDRAWSLLGSAPLIYEEFVPFDAEGRRSAPAAPAARRRCTRDHVDEILRLTLAPFERPGRAHACLRRVFDAFSYTVLLADRARGLIANEMVPRPQFRSLDHRRSRDQPVRESPAGHPRRSAWGAEGVTPR